jgi:hypothetical protein
VHYDGAKPQSCVVQKVCTKGGQTLLSLPGTREKLILSTSNIIVSQSVH